MAFMKVISGSWALKIFFFSLVFFAFQAQAKLFQNTYVSFEIPESWECKAFGTDWVCHSQLKGKNVEALITSTAKIAGSNDNLGEYKTYLQNPKSWFSMKKEQIVSEKLKEPKKAFINKFPWIDSIHKNSEIKSYISRYVVTVCCQNTSSKLGILVVLSAHQDHYAKYSADFINTVNSLRVMDIEKAISKVRASQSAGAEGMSSYMDSLFADDSEAEGLEGTSSGGLLGLSPLQFGSLALLGLGGLAYFIIKRGKGKRRRRRRSSRKK